MANQQEQHADADSGHRTWDQVQIDELAAITRRSGRQPSHDPLVGLAISGGGIRSATFALGVLETLRRCNVLRRIDYLSTVSGGGYIGAWLSGNAFRHKDWFEPRADIQIGRAHV